MLFVIFYTIVLIFLAFNFCYYKYTILFLTIFNVYFYFSLKSFDNEGDERRNTTKIYQLVKISMIDFQIIDESHKIQNHKKDTSVGHFAIYCIR